MSELERTWHILLVDDEEAITANLAPFLERSGFKVSIVSDGAQALDRVQAAPPEERSFETKMQGGWLRCCSRLSAVNRPIYLRNVEGRIIRLWPGEFEPGQWKWAG